MQGQTGIFQKSPPRKSVKIRKLSKEEYDELGDFEKPIIPNKRPYVAWRSYQTSPEKK